MAFDTFGGGVAQPAEVSYRAIALSANTTLVWASFSETSTDVVARLNHVTPAGAGLAITMPDARQRGTGQDALFRNLGADTFTLKDNGGNTIGTVASGVSVYLYLTANSTAAGSWSMVAFGTGTSSADSASLAGYGLKAVTTTLNQKHDVTTTNQAVTVDSTYRAKVVVWTDGTVACNLPAAATVGSDFFFIAKNAGGGTITLTPSGADTVDGNASLQLVPNDSVIAYSAGGTAWYTAAQGRSAAFAFTQLVKSVAGGSNVTLTAAECANKVMTFTGALTANIAVIVTNTVSVYYVYNNTSGSYTLTLRTSAGSGITIDQGTHDVAVCDATDVFRALDNVIESALYGPGSESAPSIAFTGDTNTGIYSPGADKVGVTGGGTDILRMNAAASAVNAIDVYNSATGSEVYLKPFGGDASVDLAIHALGSAGRTLLRDGNGNEVLIAAAGTASAVNEVTVTNAATGNAVTIGGTGGDANVSVLITAKGSGQVLFEDDEFVLRDNVDATKKLAFQLSGVTTGNTRTLTVPDSSGTLATDQNAVMNAIFDAKGDLVTATAADTPARLAVGTDGYTLTALSGATSGLTYLPPGAGYSLLNGYLDWSVSGNALTVAVKTWAGTDPSAADPVFVAFRDATAATGSLARIKLTAATSITINDTATLGTTSSTPFRLWCVAFNDGGTARLAVINCLSGTDIYPLGQFPIASSTQETDGADSAHVFYSDGAAVTSKASAILGYATWESGLATAGTWSSGPTRKQLYGVGVPLPGHRIQQVSTVLGTVLTATVTIPQDNTIPQNTEGSQIFTAAITPTSASNLLRIEATVNGQSAGAAGSTGCMALFQDSTANALAAMFVHASQRLGSLPWLRHDMLAGATASTTFKIRVGDAVGNYSVNGDSSATQLYGGVLKSRIDVQEIMT